MKLCLCGGEPEINYSIHRGYELYCLKCKKDLTASGYTFDWEPVIVWVHGADALPCQCPLCKLPSMIEVDDPWGSDPRVSCIRHGCLLKGKRVSLKEWNEWRPEARAFEELLKRWKGDGTKRSAAQALRRAIERHKRGRFRDPKEVA